MASANALTLDLPATSLIGAHLPIWRPNTRTRPLHAMVEAKTRCPKRAPHCGHICSSHSYAYATARAVESSLAQLLEKVCNSLLRFVPLHNVSVAMMFQAPTPQHARILPSTRSLQRGALAIAFRHGSSCRMIFEMFASRVREDAGCRRPFLTDDRIVATTESTIGLNGLQYSGSDSMRESWCASTFSLQIGTKSEPTSGLEPLTCSLRVSCSTC